MPLRQIRTFLAHTLEIKKKQKIKIFSVIEISDIQYRHRGSQTVYREKKSHDRDEAKNESVRHTLSALLTTAQDDARYSDYVLIY